MTTLKLTDSQVQALIYAMNIAEENFNNYEDWEMTDYGHDKKQKQFDLINDKLKKAGWS